jgi:hypothetical protein
MDGNIFSCNLKMLTGKHVKTVEIQGCLQYVFQLAKN